MAVKLKVSKEVTDLAEKFGSVIHTKREDYYYFPFWIREKHDGSQELVRFEQLPEEVKQQISVLRGIDKTEMNE